MGLLGAPTNFQCLMETVDHGLPNIIAYIKDLLLHSASHCLMEAGILPGANKLKAV